MCILKALPKEYAHLGDDESLIDTVLVYAPICGQCTGRRAETIEIVQKKLRPASAWISFARGAGKDQSNAKKLKKKFAQKSDRQR
ncbi:MAG: hypothetical protein K8F52_07725 [Candidatus Scalindua rubra]|nr:hypothetical protein [Candidatus Scalindua rubra]